MSAPEDSNRKAPPSLLSNPGQKGGQNASRILANLEGRVSPQQSAESAKPSRSRKGPLAVIALAVVALAGWGAWRIQAQQGAAPAVTAAVPASAASAPAAVAAASGAAAAASGTQLAQAASTPQTATIVNEEPARADADADASGARGASGSRLSQALANGATDSNAAGGAALAAAASKHEAAGEKPKTKAEKLADAKREKQEKQQERQELAAKKRHDRQLEAAAKRHPATASQHSDDPDADLLAALVARTKPADPGPPPSAKPKKAVAKVAANEATLAARVKECGTRGFFEDQLCRWRVCDGHWGKDPACPNSANQNRQP
ncbi:phage tail protein [Burkholderia glumae]|uniref:phage tail protein n=1 Tax=Burkholderia glumae TaxID=337 RepID=UPI0021514924|nr:phage tail protein [Burkholderia glumae]